jgi:hypothetical protein
LSNHARAGELALKISVLMMLPVAACTGNPGRSVSGGTTSIEPTTRSTDATDCTPEPLDAISDLGQDLAEATLAVSRLVFRCADDVVVAAPSAVAYAAPVAIELGAPLLVVEADSDVGILAEIGRLGTPALHVAGSPAIDLPRDPTIIDPPDVASRGASAEDFLRSQILATSGPIWLARQDDEVIGAAISSSVIAGGGSVVLLGERGNSTLPSTEPLIGRELGFVGALDETEQWQIESALTGPELPGGGHQVFPGRRILAFYGSPVTFRLGLLGEQGAQATIDRMAPLLADYQVEGGAPVVPGFEIVATVADSKPGDDGDFSNELTPDQIRPWVEVATANGAFVIIDLQPGRTDFLTQAKRYEEFLRLPNVGLALDPEWRLEPDQVHLRQIGSVDATEINAVGSWLATLVREENLPQKIFMLHQFNLDMITNRQTVLTPVELAVVIHVDGQGPLGSKYDTFETMVNAVVGSEQDFWWGWKNFIDEDFPTARPDQVNAVEPLPVIITFQ